MMKNASAVPDCMFVASTGLTALSKGSIATRDAPEGVLAFLREDSRERIYCVFNMSEKAALVTVPAGYTLAESGAPGISGEPQNGTLSLAPFGAYIGILR